MAKHLILSSPEVQPSITCIVVRNAGIDLVTGVGHLVIDKCDAADNVIESTCVTWALSAETLSSVTLALLASAQAAEQIPAGIVEEVAELPVSPSSYPNSR